MLVCVVWPARGVGKEDDVCRKGIPNQTIHLVIPCGNWTEHDPIKEPVGKRFHVLNDYCDMLVDMACVPEP